MKEIDNTAATGAYMGTPARTLGQWRYMGYGPPYIKAGGRVLYRRSDVDAWLEENTVRPAGDAA